MAEAARRVVDQPRRGDDRAGKARGLGIDAQAIAGLEIEVALDAEAERTLHAFELAEPNRAELREAEPEVAESEQDVRLIRPIWVISQVKAPQGSKNLTTGRWSSSGRPPFSSSRRSISLVMSLMGELPSATGGESLSLAWEPVADGAPPSSTRAKA